MLGLTEYEAVVIALLLLAAVGVTVANSMMRKKKSEPFFEYTRKSIMTRFSETGECPCCLSKNTFLAGPSGGISQNIMCSSCGSRFNVAAINGALLSMEFTHGPQPKVWCGGDVSITPDATHVTAVEAAMESS